RLILQRSSVLISMCTTNRPNRTITHLTLTHSLLSNPCAVHRDLPSFPTRRSSDLRETLIHRLTTPDGAAIGLRGEYLDAFERRDLDPTLHRKAYLEVLRQSGVSDERVAETIYASTVDVDSWVPYPDTEQALRASAHAGLAVGVLRDIAW